MKNPVKIVTTAVLVLMLTISCHKPAAPGEEIIDLLDSEHITDPVFLAYCEMQMATWDTDGDGGLSPGEVAAVTNMDVGNSSYIDVNAIASLKGIEHFTGLRMLDCYNMENLKTLDVSGCTALETLNCWGSSLTKLNVSGCTALKRLDASDNELTVLDLSGTPALTDLKCSNNRLVELNVSNSRVLRSLECYTNGLAVLDVSNCVSLADLDCYNNRLTTLDVSQNVLLRQLSCGANELTTLDVSKNTVLEYLNCDVNELTVLDLTANRELQSFSCAGNRMSILTLGAVNGAVNRRLNYFNCPINKLDAEDLNDIFRGLPDSGPEGPAYIIYIENNPGTATCDVNIAYGKNWQVEGR